MRRRARRREAGAGREHSLCSDTNYTWRIALAAARYHIQLEAALIAAADLALIERGEDGCWNLPH